MRQSSDLVESDPLEARLDRAENCALSQVGSRVFGLGVLIVADGAVTARSPRGLLQFGHALQ